MKRLSLAPALATGVLAALLFPLSAAIAQTTASTSIAGLITEDLSTGLHPLAFPLVGREVFAGTVSSNSGSVLNFASGNTGAQLAAAGRYYVEVVSGPLEGERLDVETAASMAAGNGSLVVSLGSTSLSTLNALPTNVLAGARCIVRSHITLAGLQTLFSPRLTGNNNYALADGVQFFENGALTSFYLRGDGQSWRQVGATIDERNKVIPPDASILLQIKSGAKRWTHTGTVRDTAFRKKIKVGSQSFASGYPLDLSPIQMGGFVDGAAPAGVRWVASNNPATADSLNVFNSASGVFDKYYLRADGSWQLVGGSGDVANQALLSATGMTVITRANADADYVIPPPFTF